MSTIEETRYESLVEYVAMLECALAEARLQLLTAQNDLLRRGLRSRIAVPYDSDAATIESAQAHGFVGEGRP